MYLTDGIALETSIKTVFPRHEQSASMEVDAYSPKSNKAMVVCLSTLPAASNS
jgi:thiamine pyrophosphate-dependent acetolactate synthase large subunit-like protein